MQPEATIMETMQRRNSEQYDNGNGRIRQIDATCLEGRLP